MERVDIILKKYISEKIPAKATNIFFQMFNGINAMFTSLEYRLDILKRERNMLTAQNLSSLRHMSAENGFEPKLKIPSNGLLQLQINPKLYNRVGYPLFLTPYSIFTDKRTKLNYYYNSDKSLRLSGNIHLIPVIEGEVKTSSDIGTGKTIDRFYLLENNIAQDSIVVKSNGVEFVEVKSFYDNQNLNDNKQFVVKFSNDSQRPIIVYIKGLIYKDIVEFVYRLTSGEIGNIFGKHEFETQNIIDNIGSAIDISDTEMSITNVSGFEFGSNGTDENALRAAIGYNHGKTLLFDNTSYINFLGKYSTILLQSINNSPNEKTINNIYLSKKQSLNIQSNNSSDYIDQYQSIVNAQSYFFNQQEKLSLSNIINEFEYALTSHNLYDSKVSKFAIQLTLNSTDEVNSYSKLLTELIYIEFSKFMYTKNHSINFETLFELFMIQNKITFQYVIFNQIIEAEKIAKKVETITPYIIKHDSYLPILKGDFEICDSTFTPIKLFFDINIISK